MSSAQEVSEIFEDLKDLPEDLQKSITSKFAKLTGLKLLTGETAIQRDSARLDARQRAYYKKMGLELPEDGEMITNILADNITIGEEPVIAKRNVSTLDKSIDTNTAVKPKPDPNKPQPEPTPEPPPVPVPPTNTRLPSWAIAALTALGLSSAAPWAWMALRPQEPPARPRDVQVERTTVDLTTDPVIQ